MIETTDIWQTLILLLAGIFAGFVNTVAGGGSLLTLPLMIFLGLSPTVANGTNRIALWIQCLSGTMQYAKKGVSDFRLGLWLAIPTVLGSLLGTKFAIEINELWFNRILALLMPVVLLVILTNPFQKKRSSLYDSLKPLWQNTLTAVLFFLMGIYGGFIQAGIGFGMIAVLMMTTKHDLNHINFIKVLIVLIYTSFVLITFIYYDKVNWLVGIILAIGMFLGTWLATHYSLKKGHDWVKKVLIVCVVVFSIKLLIASF